MGAVGIGIITTFYGRVGWLKMIGLEIVTGVGSVVGLGVKSGVAILLSAKSHIPGSQFPPSIHLDGKGISFGFGM